MKAIAKIGSILCLAAAFSFAETWTGKLVDANCQPQAKTSCEASPTTTSFAVQTADGKILKLDSAGNSKASAALRTDGVAKDAHVTVMGSMEGQTIKVDSIDFGNAKK
jgi:hypothetical protein